MDEALVKVWRRAIGFASDEAIAAALEATFTEALARVDRVVETTLRTTDSLDQARKAVASPRSGGLNYGLTHDEIMVACHNMGIDLTCGACAAQFYTGSAPYAHTCNGKVAAEGRGRMVVAQALVEAVLGRWADHAPYTDVALEIVNDPAAGVKAALDTYEDRRARETPALWAHCVSEHSAVLSPEMTLQHLRAYHDHEHAGPGTIHDHAKEARHFSFKKIGQVLLEADDLRGPPGGAPR